MKVLEYKMAQEVKTMIEEPTNFQGLIRSLDSSLNPEDFMIKLVPAVWDDKKGTYVGARLMFQPKEREKDPALWDEWFTELEISKVQGQVGLWLSNSRGVHLLCPLDTSAVNNWRSRFRRYIDMVTE